MPGLPGSLRQKLWTAYGLTVHACICVCLCLCVHVYWGKQAVLVELRIIVLGRAGSVSLHLDKTEQTVNRSSWPEQRIQKAGLALAGLRGLSLLTHTERLFHWHSGNSTIPRS